MVHLVEFLQSDAILLRDGVHAFARLYHVRALLILLRCLGAFLFQIDDVALVQHGVLVALVVASQFAPADSHLLAYTLEGVAFTGIEIVILVEDMDRVQQTFGVYRLVGTAVGSHEAVVALGLVILVELVELYNLYQLAGILRVGGVAAGFQSASPSLVVVQREFEEACVAWLARQKLAVVFVAVSCVLVYAEAFAPGIIVVVLGWARPVVTFYAEVVVALAYEVAPSCRTLKQSLC